jgi:phosphatidylinositol glycan class N
MFERAKTDTILNEKLRENKIFFLLHLLGLDTNGHTHLPNSKEYYDNIRLVDRRVEELEKMLNEFYENDGKTAFVFSADHGMSDRGNHGDGHPDCTRTPLVAWGAGIQTPSTGFYGKGHDTISKDWQLMAYERKDTCQADIATFISGLLGINYPMNSIGILPIDYINTDQLYKTAALFVNARGILTQYLEKEKIKGNHDYFFVPMEGGQYFNQLSISEEIGQHIAHESFDLAILKCRELIDLSLKGLYYFQTYDRPLLLTIITCGYLGFFIIGCQLICHQFHWPSSHLLSTKQQQLLLMKRTTAYYRFGFRTATFIFFVAFFLVSIYLYLRDSSWKYYAYMSIPILFFTLIIQMRPFFHYIHVFLDRRYINIHLTLLTYFLAFQMGLLAYFYRSVISLYFIAMGIWPWYARRSFLSGYKLLGSQWTF